MEDTGGGEPQNLRLVCSNKKNFTGKGGVGLKLRKTGNFFRSKKNPSAIWGKTTRLTLKFRQGGTPRKIYI